MRSDFNKSLGFTLIEMMITIAVLAILLGIAVPSFQTIILNQRIKTASFDLFSAIDYTRAEAIKRNASITLRAGASADGDWASGWRVVDSTNNPLRSWSAVSNLTVTEKQSGATTLTYGKDGRLTSAAAPKLEIAPANAATGVSSRCIQVDLSGRATTQAGACP